jgi:hypothetical protein
MIVYQRSYKKKAVLKKTKNKNRGWSRVHNISAERWHKSHFNDNKSRFSIEAISRGTILRKDTYPKSVGSSWRWTRLNNDYMVPIIVTAPHML